MHTCVCGVYAQCVCGACNAWVVLCAQGQCVSACVSVVCMCVVCRAYVQCVSVCVVLWVYEQCVCMCECGVYVCVCMHSVVCVCVHCVSVCMVCVMCGCTGAHGSTLQEGRVGKQTQRQRKTFPFDF